MWLLLIFDRFVFLHGTAARKKQSAVGQSGRDQSCVARLVLLWVCYQVEVAWSVVWVIKGTDRVSIGRKWNH